MVRLSAIHGQPSIAIVPGVPIETKDVGRKNKVTNSILHLYIRYVWCGDTAPVQNKVWSYQCKFKAKAGGRERGRCKGDGG